MREADSAAETQDAESLVELLGIARSGGSAAAAKHVLGRTCEGPRGRRRRRGR